jgi:hypothetical protein
MCGACSRAGSGSSSATAPKVVTALDWTGFDEDDRSTIVLSMIASHGRTTPLLLTTVTKSELKGWRNEHEDPLLERFLGIVKVMSADGKTKPAKGWVPKNGRPLRLRGAMVTRAGREIGAVVCVKAMGMKQAWHLATSHGDRAGAEIVTLQGGRFTIEERLRNQKNLRFGMGLSDTRIGYPDRRDCMSSSAPSPSPCPPSSAPPARPLASTGTSKPPRPRNVPSRCSTRDSCTMAPPPRR